MDYQFDANYSLSRFARHSIYSSLQLTVLGPRKTIEAQMRALAFLNPSNRTGGRKFGDRSQPAIRDDRAELIAGAHELARLQDRCLSEPARCRCANNASLDFVLKPFDYRRARLNFAPERCGLAIEVFDHCL